MARGAYELERTPSKFRRLSTVPNCNGASVNAVARAVQLVRDRCERESVEVGFVCGKNTKKLLPKKTGGHEGVSCGTTLSEGICEISGLTWTPARRTRGPNRCIALTNQRERIVVGCNEYGQPIGRNERLLSSYIGVIARDGQKAPLTYSDWRRMPVERTTDIWEAIQAKFDLCNNENLCNNEKLKRWVYIAISHSWRNWKATLKKKYYNPYWKAAAGGIGKPH